MIVVHHARHLFVQVVKRGFLLCSLEEEKEDNKNIMSKILERVPNGSQNASGVKELGRARGLREQFCAPNILKARRVL